MKPRLPLACVRAGVFCLLLTGCGAVAEPPQPEAPPAPPPNAPPAKPERSWRGVELIWYSGVVHATGADWVTLGPGWQGGQVKENQQQPNNTRPKRISLAGSPAGGAPGEENV